MIHQNLILPFTAPYFLVDPTPKKHKHTINKETRGLKPTEKLRKPRSKIQAESLNPNTKS